MNEVRDGAHAVQELEVGPGERVRVVGAVGGVAPVRGLAGESR